MNNQDAQPQGNEGMKDQEHVTYCRMEETIRKMADQMDEMHSQMFVGNGTPSISVRLDRVEQSHETSKWLTRTALGASITTIVGLAIAWLSGHLHK